VDIGPRGSFDADIRISARHTIEILALKNKSRGIVPVEQDGSLSPIAVACFQTQKEGVG